jgi:diguanylate cyclase (GGDEF)-like protein
MLEPRSNAQTNSRGARRPHGADADGDAEPPWSASDLSIAFQPIVELGSGEVFAYEALGRVAPRREGVPTSPAALLDAAYEAGRLLELDRTWRRLAIEAIARSPRSPRCFLNIDPRTAEDPAFTPGFTYAAILDAGLSPTRFVLELTERHGRNVEAMESALLHYLEQGFPVALDDVGAGAQSLERVLRLRPSFLKIDRALVHRVSHNPAQRMLVGALVEVGMELGSRVIAEGVETADDLAVLVELGVTLAQGWFFGRPSQQPDVPDPASIAALAELRLRRGRKRRRGNQMDLLRMVDDLTQAASLESALRTVTDAAARILGVERVSLRLLDGSRTGLLVAARTGESVHATADTPFVAGEGLVGAVLASGHAVRVGQALADPRFAVKPGLATPFASFLGTPLRDGSGPFGVLAATSPLVDDFDHDDEIRMRIIAGVVAPYLEARRLGRLAQTDALTGLLNRHAIASAIPEVPRVDGELAVILVDIDHFKRINDEHGHAVGDRALCDLARILGTGVRTDDRVLRMGGEEFLIALEGARCDTASTIAELLRERVRSELRVAGETITASFGVAARRPEESRESLLARADAALYEAKRLGRDRVVVDGIGAPSRRR